MFKKSIWFILIYLLLTSLVAPLLVSFVYLPVRFLRGEEVSFFTLDTPMLMWAVFVGHLLMWLVLWLTGAAGSARVSSVSSGWLCSLLSVAGMLSAAVLVSMLLEHCGDIPDWNGVQLQEMVTSFWGVLLVVFSAPLLEEFLFRGCIQRWLRARYGGMVAVLLSSLLFSLAHVNPIQMIPAFLLGLLLGWVYLRTGDLCACILMHVLNNGLSVWCMQRYGEAGTVLKLFGSSGQVAVLCATVLLLLSVGSLYVLTRSKNSRSLPPLQG